VIVRSSEFVGIYRQCRFERLTNKVFGVENERKVLVVKSLFKI